MTSAAVRPVSVGQVALTGTASGLGPLLPMTDSQLQPLPIGTAHTSSSEPI